MQAHRSGLWILLLVLSTAVIPPGARVRAVEAATKIAPLPTGVRLDAIGNAIDLGSMPLAMTVAPSGDKLAIVLSGWREQGVQIVDLRSRQLVQTLLQPAAFLGVAFSRDGRELFVSGGNDDTIFCYSWRDGTAAFERKIMLAEKSSKSGSRYPAGLAVSRVGNYLYVAENVADSLAVVDLATAKVVERFPTDHYPYAVEVAANGRIYVSAWAADTVAEFRAKADGLLTPLGKSNFVIAKRTPLGFKMSAWLIRFI
jgi:YVTN family beta-propeller protein